MSAAPKSRTLATWLALLGGSLGLHRFYLHGFHDAWGWLFAVPTLLGVYGAQRMREFGMDDRLAWLLTPLLGAMLAATMLTAIVYGLTPDTAWNRRHNPVHPAAASGWAVIFGVVVALALGATALMATIAFTAQRLFELQAAAPPPARIAPAAAGR
ncbi:MAG: NINE protein [Burkholderiaceae bacterium]